MTPSPRPTPSGPVPAADAPGASPTAGASGPPPAVDSPARTLGTALRFFVVSLVVFGVLYPAAVTGLAYGLARDRAEGSLVVERGRVVGTANAGQRFVRPEYFHGRPSAAGDGYDPMQTGGTNLGPTSRKLIAAVAAATTARRRENPGAGDAVPVELVTSSASGVDPDLSPEAALYQAERVARSRNLDFSEVRSLIMRYTHPRLLGILGEPYVDVLDLNRALDAQERHR